MVSAFPFLISFTMTLVTDRIIHNDVLSITRSSDLNTVDSYNQIMVFKSCFLSRSFVTRIGYSPRILSASILPAEPLWKPER